MKKLFIYILFFITLQTFSQIVKTHEKPMGINYTTNEEILGIQYTFPHRIYKHHIDTLSGYLTVQLRRVTNNGKHFKNKGEIRQYNLLNNELLWRKEMFYNTSTLKQYGNNMIYSTANASYCLDIHTGDKLWMINKVLYYSDPINNIGLGYKRDMASDKLKGFDLLKGDVLWKRKIDRSYAWNDLFYLNDSTMLIVSAGLHSINLKTGSGWDYHTITGEKDYTATAITNAVGIVAGVFTGTFVTATGYDLVRDIASNVIIEEEDLYFASKEKIVRVDEYTGQRKWEYYFSDDLISKSSIFSDDSLIYMVNYGYAIQRNNQISYGKPFIAAFYKDTGEKKFISLVNTTVDPILDYKIEEQELIIVFKDRLLKHSLTSGNLILEKEISEEYQGIQYFLGNNIYIASSENKYISLPESDSTASFLYNNDNNGVTIAVDPELNHLRSIEYDSLYVLYLETNKLKFIASNFKTSIINSEGKKVAELDISSNATLIGNILYDKQGDSFWAVDISDILENCE